MTGEHYRDMAEHFRVLAELEPLPSLRRLRIPGEVGHRFRNEVGH
jgi:hypothetical protein